MSEVTLGMDVHAGDGKVGRVDDVLASGETGQPVLLVVSTGFFKSDVVVPYESVQRVDDAGVWLALTRDEVQHAPAYDAAHHGSAAGLVSRAVGRYGED